MVEILEIIQIFLGPPFSLGYLELFFFKIKMLLHFSSMTPCLVNDLDLTTNLAGHSYHY